MINIIKEKFKEIEEEKNSKDLTLRIDRASIIEFMDFLYRDERLSFSFLTDICGVDYPERKERFDVVYHLYSIEHNHRLCVKIAVKEGGEIASISSIWRGANWHEREIFDMFGIKFSNHKNLKRILLKDNWDGYPLRKDYPLEGQYGA